MIEIWERTLNCEEVEKAIAKFAGMSDPPESHLSWEVDADGKPISVTIRQQGWNKIEGQSQRENQ